MIPEEVIIKIRKSVDIVKVVGSVIELKNAGKNYKGSCPFHEDKISSLLVSPEKQIFHCFGCNIGGNVFTFLMEYEKISFVQAVEKLSEQVGIDIKKYTNKEGG